MAENYWDNTGAQPNLSRLPIEVRESMSRPVPMRPDEVYAAVMVFKQSPGLNHPNGRCNVTAYHAGENAAVPVAAGLQIDLAEYTGRFALATVIVDVKYAEAFLSGLMRAYVALGGSAEAVMQRAGVSRLPAEHIAYFEEKNNE